MDPETGSCFHLYLPNSDNGNPVLLLVTLGVFRLCLVNLLRIVRLVLLLILVAIFFLVARLCIIALAFLLLVLTLPRTSCIDLRVVKVFLALLVMTLGLAQLAPLLPTVAALLAILGYQAWNYVAAREVLGGIDENGTSEAAADLAPRAA